MSKKLGRYWVLLGGIFLMVLGGGCGSSREVAIGIADDGREIQLESGQILVLELEANPTTGFRWEVNKFDGAVLRLQGEPDFESSSEGDLVGAGGVEIFRFEALSSGVSALELIYHRTWEEEEPLETYSVRVVVRQGQEW